MSNTGDDVGRDHFLHLYYNEQAQRSCDGGPDAAMDTDSAQSIKSSSP